MTHATHSYRTRLHDFLDSRDFYELCQNYRHVNPRLYQSEGKTVEAFEALKAAILEQAIGADYKVNVPPPGPSGGNKLTNREEGYLGRMRDRCNILKARIGNGYSDANFIGEWKRELHAIEWAISRLGATPREDSQS